VANPQRGLARGARFASQSDVARLETDYVPERLHAAIVRNVGSREGVRQKILAADEAERSGWTTSGVQNTSGCMRPALKNTGTGE
jgi:hypothetical protein